MRKNPSVEELLEAYKPDHSLPGALYYDQAVYDFEMEAIWKAEWLFICNECELPEPGDFRTIEIGNNSIIIVRSDENTVKAFYNTCRHRGSRICLEERGSSSRLTCPYHQWTYDLNGKLIFAQQVAEHVDFNQHGLKPVNLTNIAGLIYICLSDVPPDIEKFRASVLPFVTPYEPAKTKVVYESVIIEKANWKLVMENNRECYHCAGSHPELLVSLVESALPDDPKTPGFLQIMEEKIQKWESQGLPHEPVEGGNEFRCIRLPFNPGVMSMTLDGKLGCKKLISNFTDPDRGDIRMFRVPNSWHHFLADHIMHFRILPKGPYETEVRTTWHVHPDALEGWDYDPDRLAEVWLSTNAQDKHLAEQNALGVQSDAYEPGPYSPTGEFMVEHFNTWYMEAMRAMLSATSKRRASGE